jgi:hypothetical protein
LAPRPANHACLVALLTQVCLLRPR